jgi:putative FmdB family regulatory protein
MMMAAYNQREEVCSRRMPIYEFYCGGCHRVDSFLSRSIATRKSPECPRCHQPIATRLVSSFAVSKGRKEEAVGGAEGDMPDVDEAKLMRLMEEMGPEAENINEDDPRQAARMMRRLFDATGMPVGAGMEEAMRRMEAGEDPEKVEQDLGDVLEQDPFAPGAATDGGARSARGRRRLLPPTIDPTLYEM